MALSPKELTLQAALEDCKLRNLPAKLKPESSIVWLTAIALVTKLGSRQEYVRVVNDGYNKPTVKKDYGIPAVITSIDEIYPIDVLDKSKTPDLRSNEAIIKFLGKNGYQETVIEAMLSKEGKTPEQAKEDRTTVKGYVTHVAIILAKKTIAEEERCNEIKEYGKRIKTNGAGNAEKNEASED